MSKQDYFGRLKNTAGELRQTIRNWQARMSLRSALEPLVVQLEAVIASLKQSENPAVPEETAKAVWTLMEAIDEAAKSTENKDVVDDVHVITTGVRQFYFSRGAKIDTDGRISF